MFLHPHSHLPPHNPHFPQQKITTATQQDSYLFTVLVCPNFLLPSLSSGFLLSLPPPPFFLSLLSLLLVLFFFLNFFFFFFFFFLFRKLLIAADEKKREMVGERGGSGEKEKGPDGGKTVLHMLAENGMLMKSLDFMGVFCELIVEVCSFYQNHGSY